MHVRTYVAMCMAICTYCLHMYLFIYCMYAWKYMYTAVYMYDYLLYTCRLLTRVVIIPFKEPSIRAHTEEQREAFTSLEHLKDTANSSIGYYIALGKLYRDSGIFEVDEYEQRLSTLLPNCGGRTVKGYANLMWFTKQISTKINN